MLKSKILFFLFFLLLAFIFLFTGATSLNFSGLFTDGFSSRILFDLRLPRLILVLVVGGSLAILGGSYQILFHNILAEPYILGISNATILGIAIGEVFFGIEPTTFKSILIGSAFAIFSTILILFVYLSNPESSIHKMVLFGIGMQFVFSSLLFLLLSFRMKQVGGGSLRWLFGQLPWLNLNSVLIIFLIFLIFLFVSIVFSRHLDALSLGDSVCRTLGYSPINSRIILLTVTSLFLAFLTSIVGAIGFVGLVIPHASRLLFSPSTTRKLFIFSLFLGGTFLVLADILSRTLMTPSEFPIGIITTILGGPVFLFLLWKYRT